MDDDFEAYGRRIGGIPLLDAAEEIELAKRIAAGDAAARRRMIEANLRLVVSIALRHRGRGVPLMDLIEEGNLGLIRAVERFDVDRQCRFSTYAVWWILQSVRKALSSSGRGLRLPVRVARWATRVRHERERLALRLGRSPAQVELSECLRQEGSERRNLRLARWVAAAENVASLEALPDAEDVGAEGERPFEAALEHEDLARLDELIEQLPPRERNLLVLRYGLGEKEPMSLQQIADETGMNRETVRQLERRLLRRLARGLDAEPDAVSPRSGRTTS